MHSTHAFDQVHELDPKLRRKLLLAALPDAAVFELASAGVEITEGRELDDIASMITSLNERQAALAQQEAEEKEKEMKEGAVGEQVALTMPQVQPSTDASSSSPGTDNGLNLQSAGAQLKSAAMAVAAGASDAANAFKSEAAKVTDDERSALVRRFARTLCRAELGNLWRWYKANVLSIRATTFLVAIFNFIFIIVAFFGAFNLHFLSLWLNFWLVTISTCIIILEGKSVTFERFLVPWIEKRFQV
jgi:hypothetical protein